MPATLDPSKAHLVRHHGEITAIFTWVNGERSMVLVANRRPPGSPWYVIMESVAYLYADNVGNPTERMIVSAAKAASVLSLDQSRSAIKKIVDIVVDGLPDLIRMPSAPPAELAKHAIGELNIMADGELVGGDEIRPELSGVEYG